MKILPTATLFLLSLLPLAAQGQRSIFAGFDWSFRAPTALGIDGVVGLGPKLYGTITLARAVNLPVAPTYEEPASDMREQIIPTLQNVRSMITSDISLGLGAGYRLITPLMVSANIGMISRTQIHLGDLTDPNGGVHVMHINTDADTRPLLGADGHLFLAKDQVKLSIGYDTERGWRAGLALGF